MSRKHLFATLLLWLLLGISPAWAGAFDGVITDLQQQGEQTLAQYQPQAGELTADRFSDLYFDTFEASGLEKAIGARDARRLSRMESLFGRLISLAGDGQPREQLAPVWAQLRQLLQQERESSDNQGFWPQLIQSLLILLREGFEAILVITALAAYLQRRDETGAMPALRYGLIWGLLASLLTAWVISQLVENAGPAREVLEGTTQLVAAAVLFYVSYWLISKQQAARWQSWVQGQLDRALGRGSRWALGFACFLAVYREGAETVLFYQALAGQAGGYTLPLWIGMGLAAGLLLLGYRALRSAALRLPLGSFFGVTAVLLYVLAFSFAGNGIAELQEARWVSATPLFALPEIGWLGIHPTLESSLAQLLVLLPLPFALWWMGRDRRSQAQ